MALDKSYDLTNIKMHQQLYHYFFLTQLHRVLCLFVLIYITQM